jgi:CheY-like chemotaxis protein
MNAIIGMAELALRESIPSSAFEMVMSIKTAGSSLLSIINDILDLSKIESGKMELVESEYRFSSLIQDVVGIIRTRLTEKPIELFVYVDNRVPNRLVGDEVRIRQIFLNLLSNAVKYTKEGFVKLNVTCEFLTEGWVDFTFSFEDSGIGIKPENLKELFSNFTQFDKAANKGIEGTGLGLAITRNLARLMNGDIQVESEYGKGSTFTARITQRYVRYVPFSEVIDPDSKHLLVYEPRKLFADLLRDTLAGLGVKDVNMVDNPVSFSEEVSKGVYNYVFVPNSFYTQAGGMMARLTGDKGVKLVLMAESRDMIGHESITTLFMPVYSLPLANILNDVDARETYQRQTSASVRFTAPDARILVVDDIVTNLKVAAGLLAPFRIQVDTCESGAEAIELVQANRYDLVFMDHMMPVMDGLEATARIRQLPEGRDLPVVALTANAVSGVREMFLAAGLNDFISKPIDPTKLEGVLVRWIPKEKHRREYQTGDPKRAAKARRRAAKALPGQAGQAGQAEDAAVKAGQAEDASVKAGQGDGADGQGGLSAFAAAQAALAGLAEAAAHEGAAPGSEPGGRPAGQGAFPQQGPGSPGAFPPGAFPAAGEAPEGQPRDPGTAFIPQGAYASQPPCPSPVYAFPPGYPQPQGGDGYPPQANGYPQLPPGGYPLQAYGFPPPGHGYPPYPQGYPPPGHGYYPYPPCMQAPVYPPFAPQAAGCQPGHPGPDQQAQGQSQGPGRPSPQGQPQPPSQGKPQGYPPFIPGYPPYPPYPVQGYPPYPYQGPGYPHDPQTGGPYGNYPEAQGYYAGYPGQLSGHGSSPPWHPPRPGAPWGPPGPGYAPGPAGPAAGDPGPAGKVSGPGGPAGADAGADTGTVTGTVTGTGAGSGLDAVLGGGEGTATGAGVGIGPGSGQGAAAWAGAAGGDGICAGTVGGAGPAGGAVRGEASGAGDGTGDPVDAGGGDGGGDEVDGYCGDDVFEGFDVEGVDLDDGLNRLGGSEELYLEVMDAYVRFTAKVLDQVREPPAGEGLKDYAVLVHGIKGSSYNIGAVAVGRAAETLEHAAKAGDLAKVRECHGGFIEAARRLVAGLKAFLDRVSPPGEAERDSLASPPADILRRILAACGSFDMDAMEGCVKELERHSYETNGELVPWLREQMENLEYDAIAERLERELSAG